MDINQIRQLYLDHFTEHGHQIIDRAPLVLNDDATTLFTGSGMQPLLPYLLGADHPAGDRLVDVQPCLRSQDIEEVGDNRHTTFFEMLGNWSLGGYFKDEQIRFAWDFLVNKVGLDPARMYVSVYSGDQSLEISPDDESAQVWHELFSAAGVSTDRIDLVTEERGNAEGSGGARICGYRDKNWWSRGGGPETMPVGDPGGPDTEIFYYFPQVEHDKSYGEHPHPNSDGGQYLEIGNSVFMQFQRTENGLSPLPRRNVDFGGGLERIAAAAIDSPDVYRVGTLAPIVSRIEELSGRAYDDDTEAMRVIADHVRGAVFLIADGVRPSGKEHGYVLRRLLRRAIRFAHAIECFDGTLESVADAAIDAYAAAYPTLDAARTEILGVLAKEERQFRRTLGKGLRELRRLGKESRPLSGADLFTLYERFGFPVELAAEEANRLGVDLLAGWRADFDTAMERQRQMSRASSTLGT
ncbi:alanine--tRNA ligase-related protein [Gordonia phthalatica]|uniref:alanine--tRNA ligase n=1 Tax=Gordonia phthalatica TaxID=1136941 RepID=A0A0N9NAM5_9ACTN|nr:alanine--tRNA ligase-related protein [Gordonia phthalatica]ALG84066.1 alanyl-tRNA synthetase [Gordonia phthalatica]